MNWKIIVDPAWDDFSRLSDDERIAVSTLLLAWTEAGPPLKNRRIVGGIEIYEDQLGLYKVTYFIGDDPEPYVAIMRLRAE